MIQHALPSPRRRWIVLRIFVLTGVLILAAAVSAGAQSLRYSPQFLNFLEAAERVYYTPIDLDPALVLENNPLHLAVFLGHALKAQAAYVERFEDRREDLAMLEMQLQFYLGAAAKAAGFPKINGERVDRDLMWETARKALKGDFDAWLEEHFGLGDAKMPVVIEYEVNPAGYDIYDGSRGDLDEEVSGKIPLLLQILQTKAKDRRLSDPNPSDEDLNALLLKAAEEGKLETLKQLIGKGADIHSRDGTGYSAIQFAAMNGDADMTKFLLTAGAKVNDRTDFGDTPLHNAKTKEVAVLLVEAGADIEAVDEEFGMTPIFNCGFDVFMYLIEQGADFEAKSKKGMTPLVWSAYGPALDKIRVLIEKGADVNSGEGRLKTALQIAANWGHLDLVRFLVEKGARVKGKDGSGMTALHWAALEGTEAVADFLIGKGAEINALTKPDEMYPKGATPVDIAEGAGYTPLARFLRSKGGKPASELK